MKIRRNWKTKAVLVSLLESWIHGSDERIDRLVKVLGKEGEEVASQYGYKTKRFVEDFWNDKKSMVAREVL